MSKPGVTLYSTSSAGTVKVRSDIGRIKTLLDAKRVQYAEIDLAMEPQRRTDMLSGSGGITALPQLHVNGRYIGTADEIQEFEDWGELDGILQGLTPEEAAAAAAAAAAGLLVAEPSTQGAAEPANPPATGQPPSPAAEAAQVKADGTAVTAPQHPAPAAPLKTLSSLACQAKHVSASTADSHSSANPAPETACASPQARPEQAAECSSAASQRTSSTGAQPLLAAASVVSPSSQVSAGQGRAEPATAAEEQESAAAAARVAQAAFASVLAAAAATEAEERLAAAVASVYQLPARGSSPPCDGEAKEAEAARSQAHEAAKPLPALRPVQPTDKPGLSAGPAPDTAAASLAGVPPGDGAGVDHSAPCFRKPAAAAAVAAIKADAADIIKRALRAAERLDAAGIARHRQQAPQAYQQLGEEGASYHRQQQQGQGSQQTGDRSANTAEAVAALQLESAELPSPSVDSAKLICSPIRLRPDLPQLAGGGEL